MAVDVVTLALAKGYTDESGAEAIEQTYADNGVLGAKNLFNASKYDGTDDVGITTTKNTDGSITINGTTTDLYFFPNDNGSILLDFYGLTEGKKYYFSTGVDNSNIRLQLYKKATSTDAWSLASQVNSGEDLLVDLTESFYDIWLRIYIPNGTTISDVTLYPMVRLASDTDTTYQPYAMTNAELTEAVSIFSSAFTDAIGTVSNNYLYKQGANVMGILELNSVTASADDVIAVLPSGYRPPNDFTLPLGAPTSKSVRIQSAGNVVALSELSSVNIRFGGSWLSI